MWISKKKHKVMEERIANLEETQGRQCIRKVSEEVFIKSMKNARRRLVAKGIK